METSNDFCVVMTTVDSEADAHSLAGSLVDAGLAACVQVLPMMSFYVWKGERRSEAEYLLQAKTRTALLPALENFIRTHHPYELPELLQMPVVAGAAGYLQWLRDGTRADSPQAAQE